MHGTTEMPLAWIALNAAKGLGPVRIHQLIARYGSPEAVFDQTSSELRSSGCIPASVVEQLRSDELNELAQRQLDLAGELNVTILTLADDRYPPLLREIFAPPPVLFVRGTLDVFTRHAVALVGMRGPGTYGRDAAILLARELTEHGLVVVSGLAFGIDAIGHRACLDAGGETIAVLGSGVDLITPASNRQLGERVMSSGALVSEFPLGTNPEPFNFPRRNRVISGLAAGVVVVEAGSRSGSLITAHYAIQQGREVFAVPGSIFSEKSNGTLNLIRQGAIPVKCAREIVENIEVMKHACARGGGEVGTQAACPTHVTRMPRDLLSAPEQRVLDSLSADPERADRIAQTCGTTVTELFSILLNLELKGFARQLAGQQYVRI